MQTEATPSIKEGDPKYLPVGKNASLQNRSHSYIKLDLPNV